MLSRPRRETQEKLLFCTPPPRVHFLSMRKRKCLPFDENRLRLQGKKQSGAPRKVRHRLRDALHERRGETARSED